MPSQTETPVEPNVVIHPSKYNSCQDIFETVLKEYAERLCVRFVLRAPHKTVRHPPRKPREDTVYIYLWCAPARTAKTQIKKVFGHDLDVGSSGINALLPSEEGIVICDDDGVEAAEVVGRSIYVLFALGVNRKAYVESLLRSILEAALFWIREATDEDRKAYEENRKTGERDRFARLFGDFYGTLRKLEKDLEGEKKKIEELQRVLTRNIECAALLEDWIAATKARGAQDGETVKSEYDKILAMPKVESLKVYSGRMTVFTETIIMTYRNLSFEIGEFRIDIDLSGKGMRFFNLTHPKPDKKCELQHPNVWPDGIPCLGNIKEAIPPLIAQREMATVVVLSLQYLETLNLEDERTRKKFFYWPMVGESEEERDKRLRAFEECLRQKQNPELEENPVPLLEELYCTAEEGASDAGRTSKLPAAS